MEERFEKPDLRPRREVLARGAASRRLTRALRAEDRARRIERRVEGGEGARSAGGKVPVGLGGGGWRGVAALWGLTAVPFFRVPSDGRDR